MKRKSKVIKDKALLRQIAEDSGYRIYEIQDILDCLAICIADNANSGYDTLIKGIGTFRLKPGYNIRGRSNLTGEEYNTLTARSLSLKIDSLMRNKINKQAETNNALNGEENG